jgi:hypothetical protein
MSCKKEESEFSKCFTTQGAPTLNIVLSLVSATSPLTVSATTGAVAGTVSGPVNLPNGAVYNIIGGTITGTIAPLPLVSGQYVLNNAVFVGSITGPGVSTSFVTGPEGLPVSNATVSVDITVSPIVGTLLTGTIVVTPTDVGSYTPLVDFTLGTSPTFAVVHLVNKGTAAEAIYYFSSNQDIVLPVVLPTIASTSGSNGLYTVLMPNSSTTLTIQNLSLLFAVPFVLPTVTSLVFSSLEVKLNLKFCFDSCESSADCKIETVFVDTCNTIQGSCAFPDAAPQVLFGATSPIPKTIISEIVNSGTCAATLSVTRSSDTGALSFFPFAQGIPALTYNLLGGQTMIVGVTSLSELTAICLPPAVSTVVVPANGTAVLPVSAEGTLVIADESKPTPNPDGSGIGWHFQNPGVRLNGSVSDKFNWYMYAAGIVPLTTYANVETAWVRATIAPTADTTQLFFNVYSAPTGLGDAGSFYHSRAAYTFTPGSAALGQDAIYYILNDPGVNVYPNLPHILVPFNVADFKSGTPITTNFSPTDAISLIDFGSNTIAPPSSVNLTVYAMGTTLAGVSTELDLFTSLPSSATVATTCSVTASLKAFYCIPSCNSKGVSPMVVTGFGGPVVVKEKSKKKKSSKSISMSMESSSRFVSFN